MIRHLAYLLPVSIFPTPDEGPVADRLATVVVCRATTSTTALVETTLDPARTTCPACLREHGDDRRAHRIARLGEDVRRALAIALVWDLVMDDEPPTVLYADIPARLPELEIPRGTSLDNAYLMRRTALESERYRLRLLTNAQLAHARQTATKQVA
ncbi:hypothetical protein ACX12M_17315 [Cellulosimicrobium cellulans]